MEIAFSAKPISFGALMSWKELLGLYDFSRSTISRNTVSRTAISRTVPFPGKPFPGMYHFPENHFSENHFLQYKVSQKTLYFY